MGRGDVVDLGCGTGLAGCGALSIALQCSGGLLPPPSQSWVWQDLNEDVLRRRTAPTVRETLLVGVSNVPTMREGGVHPVVGVSTATYGGRKATDGSRIDAKLEEAAIGTGVERAGAVEVEVAVVGHESDRVELVV